MNNHNLQKHCKAMAVITRPYERICVNPEHDSQVEVIDVREEISAEGIVCRDPEAPVYTVSITAMMDKRSNAIDELDPENSRTVEDALLFDFLVGQR